MIQQISILPSEKITKNNQLYILFYQNWSINHIFTI